MINKITESEIELYEKQGYQYIYALSADYDKNTPITKEFFATVQNKLHWPITGKTAAEKIYNLADVGKKHVGLTNWKQAPDVKIEVHSGE